MIAYLDNEILRLIFMQSCPTHYDCFIGRVALWPQSERSLQEAVVFIMVKGAGVVDRRTLARLAPKGTCSTVHDLPSDSHDLSDSCFGLVYM